MAVSILKCPYCSDSIRKSGAYIVGIAKMFNINIKLLVKNLHKIATILRIGHLYAYDLYVITMQDLSLKWELFQLNAKYKHKPVKMCSVCASAITIIIIKLHHQGIVSLYLFGYG